jgi:phosphate transport system permease protein
MAERHQDTLEFFIASGASDGGDGTPDRPFRSLPQALAAVQERGDTLFAQTDGGDGPRQLEISVLKAAGSLPQAGGRPQHEFFIDTRSGGEGEGSQWMPWPGLSVAVSELLQRTAAGQLSLRPGQRLRITRREVFAATDFERWKKRKEALARTVFLGMTLLLVAPVVVILTYLVVKAWPVLTPAFLFTNPQDRMTAGGVWAPLIGTFFVVLLSLLGAAPIGVLAGVYLNEYARDNWATRIVNLAVVNLAGVPSIVHALFGVGAFVLFAGMGRSLAAASCTVAVMTLPVIITSSREALAAVPMAFREACWNMGATRWQTIRTIVLPNSISGILTGVILQVARAAGETAPILFTGAVFFVPIADSGWEAWFPYGLGDRFMALSMHLFTLAIQVKGVEPAVEYGAAVVLIGLVLVVNSVSIGVRVYLRSRKRW